MVKLSATHPQEERESFATRFLGAEGCNLVDTFRCVLFRRWRRWMVDSQHVRPDTLACCWSAPQQMGLL